MTLFESAAPVLSGMQSHLRPIALVAKNLTVARGDITLCSQVNFSVSSGQILHITGSNGIGKTTLIMMLAGLIPVSDLEKAQLMWGDSTPEDWSVIYMSHASGLNLGLSVGDNLRFMQSLNSNSGVHLARALDAVGLSGYEDMTVANLSSGQKRRVNLARLWLSGDADRLWLLDEPFTALDTAMVKRLNTRLIEHTTSGGRVILTSHQALGMPVEILNLQHYAIQHDDIDAEWASKC